MELLSKHFNSLVLLIGLGYSLYHNVKSNKAKIEDNASKIVNLEATTVKFIDVINKMMIFIKELTGNKEGQDASVRRVHERIDAEVKELSEEIDDIKEKFVSHQFCEKAMENIPRRNPV